MKWGDWLKTSKNISNIKGKTFLSLKDINLKFIKSEINSFKLIKDISYKYPLLNDLYNNTKLKEIFDKKFDHKQVKSVYKFKILNTELSKTIFLSLTTRRKTLNVSNIFLFDNKIINKAQFINPTDIAIIDYINEGKIFETEKQTEITSYLQEELNNNIEIGDMVGNIAENSLKNYINSVNHSLGDCHNKACIRCMEFWNSECGEILLQYITN